MGLKAGQQVHWISAAAIILAALCLQRAEARDVHALLVGNRHYRAGTGWAEVVPAHRDVDDFAKLLGDIGVPQASIAIVKDATAESLREGLDAFARKLTRAKDGDLVVFVYSGHGVSRGTTNWMVGIDGSFQIPGGLAQQPRERAIEGELQRAAVSETLLLSRLQERRNLSRLVVLDMCRGEGIPLQVMQALADGDQKSGSRPPSMVKAPSQLVAKGTVIAYSSGEKSQSYWPNNEPNPNSLFIGELIRQIRLLPGAEFVKVMQKTTDALEDRAGNLQTPMYHSPRAVEIFLWPTTKEAAAPADAVPAKPDKAAPATMTASRPASAKPPAAAKISVPASPGPQRQSAARAPASRSANLSPRCQALQADYSLGFLSSAERSEYDRNCRG